MDESSCCSTVSPAFSVVRITHFDHSYRYVGASQVAPVVKNSGEGNGNPLQYSSLENSIDRGTWWVTVHGVPKSQTQLKQLSTYIGVLSVHTHRYVVVSQFS